MKGDLFTCPFCMVVLTDMDVHLGGKPDRWSGKRPGPALCQQTDLDRARALREELAGRRFARPVERK